MSEIIPMGTKLLTSGKLLHIQNNLLWELIEKYKKLKIMKEILKVLRKMIILRIYS